MIMDWTLAKIERLGHGMDDGPAVANDPQPGSWWLFCLLMAFFVLAAISAGNVKAGDRTVLPNQWYQGAFPASKGGRLPNIMDEDSPRLWQPIPDPVMQTEKAPMKVRLSFGESNVESTAETVAAEIPKPVGHAASCLVKCASGTGSGVVAKNDGVRSCVLTAAHVVANPNELQVRIGEKWIDAKIVKRSIANDLAMLQVDGVYPAFGEKIRRAKRGESVTIVAKSTPLEEKISATTDVVNFEMYNTFKPAKPFEGAANQLGYNFENGDRVFFYPYFGLSKPLTQGMSGGPVFSPDGSLLGVLYATDGRNGYAIDGELVSKFLTDTRPIVTCWISPRPGCSGCRITEKQCGDGDERTAVEYLKGPPSWLATFQALNPGQPAAYPMFETHASGEWKVRTDLPPANLDDLAAFSGGGKTAAAARRGRSMQIHGKATIGAILDATGKTLGDGRLDVTWKRVGKSRLPMKQQSFAEFLGESGRIELDLINTPVQQDWPTHFGAAYTVKGNDVSVAADPFTVPLPSPNGTRAMPTQGQATGSPILIAWTILGIAQDIWAILHPQMSLILPPETRCYAACRDGGIRVDFNSPPRIEMEWSFLFGLLRPSTSVGVNRVVIARDKITVETDSRIVPRLEIEVVE